MEPVSERVQYEGHKSLKELEGKDTSGRAIVVKTSIDEVTGKEIKTVKALSTWQKIWASVTSCFGSKYETITNKDLQNLTGGALKTGLDDNTRILGAIVLKRHVKHLAKGETVAIGVKVENALKNYSNAVITTVLDSFPKDSHADKLLRMEWFQNKDSKEKITMLAKLGVNLETGFGDKALEKFLQIPMSSEKDFAKFLGEKSEGPDLRQFKRPDIRNF